MRIRYASEAVILAFLLAAATTTGRAWAEAYAGYTLFSPNNSTHSYLVDMANQEAKHWTHNRSGGYSCYLLENGNLIRTAMYGTSLNGGGAQGAVQVVAPNGTLVWEYLYSTSLHRSHHDIEPMPNGNVILIAWEKKTAAQAVQAGLDTSTEIWPDHLIEVQPVGSNGGNIVWEWHAWDHLIQDHDATKDNYGVVGDHPELLDINLGNVGGLGGGDWMHTNGVSYDPMKDQVVISSHNLNEFWVIDHSTTTAEAAGHTGGNAGMGGDILYRWGNPSNYDRPGTQYFRVVHSSVWIPEGYPGQGNIMAFNNRENMGTSIVCEIAPPYQGQYNYYLASGQAYGPSSPAWTWTASGFYSNHLGSCQRLANGNTLACEATSGVLWEVDAAGVVQWNYARGGEIPRAQRYGNGYPGLSALGLTAGAPAGGTALDGGLRLGQSHPNPCRGRSTIAYDLPAGGHVSLRLFDVTGREVARLVDQAQSAGPQSVTFDAGRLLSGTYFYRLQLDGTAETRRLVLQR